MKRLISNISNKVSLNNSKIIFSKINFTKNNISFIKQQQQPIYTQLSHNNTNINNFTKFNRFYCKKTVSDTITDAEIDHHVKDENDIIDSSDHVVKIEPKYYIEFTCTYVDPKEKTECGFVSKKTFSKHSYHKGVVLIKCDGCKKIHTIADNLGWTGYENAKNIEEIMAEKGETVKRYLLKQDEVEGETKSDEPILIGEGKETKK